MPQNLTDNVVIGGGLAGCAAGILLARAGRAVTLLEKSTAAQDKVCGEFISWEAAHYLQTLGIDLPALGATTIHALRLTDGARRIEAPLPFTAFSLSRRVLDDALLNCAVHAGVTVRRGVTVSGFRAAASGWEITAGDDTLNAGTIFLASGKHDVRGQPRPVKVPHDLIGFKMHLRLRERQLEILRDHVEIHLYDGGYAGLELIEENKANLCFLVRKDIYAPCGKNWPALLDWLKEQSPLLRDHLQDATALWPQPLAIANTPYGYLYDGPAPSGLYRLGDQLAVIPSFAGDGMAMALHSGFQAVRYYLDGTPPAAFYVQARSDFTGPLQTSRLTVALTAGPLRRRAVFALANTLPRLIPRIMSSMRLKAETLATEMPAPISQRAA